jgi:hypothetical protein
LLEKLTPKYTAGCKRINISSDFLPMFVKVGMALFTASERIS